MSTNRWFGTLLVYVTAGQYKPPSIVERRLTFIQASLNSDFEASDPRSDEIYHLLKLFQHTHFLHVTHPQARHHLHPSTT